MEGLGRVQSHATSLFRTSARVEDEFLYLAIWDPSVYWDRNMLFPYDLGYIDLQYTGTECCPKIDRIVGKKIGQKFGQFGIRSCSPCI